MGGVGGDTGGNTGTTPYKWRDCTKDFPSTQAFVWIPGTDTVVIEWAEYRAPIDYFEVLTKASTEPSWVVAASHVVGQRYNITRYPENTAIKV